MNNILKQFFPVADCIAGMFGKDCEVVVHDLTQPESSVVYVSNGSVTGREVGQSFDHLIKQLLSNNNLQNDCLCNYSFTTPKGKQIKSSSALIRDDQGDVIGMICINYDLTFCHDVYQRINSFLNTSGMTPQSQEVDDDVILIIDRLITKIMGSQDAKNLTRRKCVELVGFMEEKGIFMVKGAVDKVAALMGVSRVTIYSYLDEAKARRPSSSAD